MKKRYDKEKLYTIQKIVASKVYKGKKYYLIKWKGQLYISKIF